MRNSFLKIYKTNFLALCLLVATTFSYAQLAAPFKIRHQGYVTGDMTMIANNIVNRVDYNNDANSPHDNRAYQGELNDEYMMLYTDIDNDKSTFSSSSADLYLNNPLNKKIVYAGLYWSATYLYNSGVSKGVDKYKAVDAKREPFSPIKIKLPNQKEYTTLGGELIFDGVNEPKFKESAPYAMYADITQMVKNLKDPTGTYTVANIKATQGKLSGGVAAGWSMFFVYEDVDMPGKFITTYDGFAGVTDKPTEINFSGFQTLPMGEVKARIACAALEGDLNLKGDQIQFKAAENNEFTQLQSPLRDRANIFNSSITIDDKFFDARVPASKNTLGYDSFIMNINNFDNSVLGNNTTDATVKLKTTGDRYFVFFNAFDVEVVKPKDLVKNEEPIVIKTEIIAPTEIKKLEPVVIATPKAEKPIEVIKPEPVVVAKPKGEKPVEVIKEEPIVVKAEPVLVKSEPVKEILVAESKPTDYGTIQNTDKQTIIKNNQIVVVNSPKSTSQTYNVASTTPAKAPMQSVSGSLKSQTLTAASRPTPIESPAVIISNQPEGYYLIVNVFAIHSNATKFVAKLKRKGMFAEYFINPINNYRYVYVSKHDNFADATQMYASNINGQYYDAFWIMTVNKQNNPAVASLNTMFINNPLDDNSAKVAVLNREAVLVATDRRKVS
jgi:hypothetical protein